MITAVSSPHFSHMPFINALDVVSLHFNSWEIVAEYRHRVPDIEKDFLEYVPSYNLSFSVHAPMSDINIGSLSDGMLNASLNELISCMESCNKLGIETVTVHPCFMSPIGMVNKDMVFSTAKRSLSMLEKAASNLGIRLALENMPSGSMCMCKYPEELLALLDGTNIGICFDIGHANTTGTIDGFLDLKDRFENIHIHDNMGTYDEHLPIGSGTVDFSKVLKSLGSRRYVIESRGLDDALESKQTLLQMTSLSF